MRSAKSALLSVVLMCYSGWLGAQDCALYYPVSKGSEWELWNYDDKDKETSKVHYTVLDSKNTGNGVEARLLSEILDKKNKSTSTTEFTMSCSDGIFSIDMRSFMPKEQLSAYNGMDIKMTGNNLDIPSTLTTGQKLNDGLLTSEISNNGMPFSKIEVHIINRVVSGQETITVPAGTFDCYKISYNIKLTSSTMGFAMDMSFDVVDWISVGSGLIRSESSQEKGKSVSYTVLGMLKK